MDLIRRIPRSFFFYVVIGFFATLADWAAFWFVSIFLAKHYMYGTTASFVCGSIVNFTLNKKYTFRNGSTDIKKQAMKHVSVGLFGLSITYVLMYLAIDVAGFPYMVGKIMATAINPIYGYIAHKHITFNDAVG